MSASGLAAHPSPAELGQRYRAARSPIERSHLQAVWLVSRGRSERAVAQVTGYGRRWVGEVARRYEEAGPDGLGDWRRGNAGARPLLGAEDEAALRAALAEPPADGGLWTGPKVATWMAARPGRKVWPQRGWDYLKKLGYSAQRPRPRHAKAASPEEQAAYKKGSIRVGCWDWACGGQEPSSRGTWLGRPLQGPSPAEIVRQVARCDAVEAAHPALQPAVVGVHVLDVEGAVAHPDPGGDIDRLVADATLSGEGDVGLGAVRAQHGVAGDHGPERRPDGLGPEVGQHGIDRVAGAVAGDQRRDLLGREAPLAGRLAAPV